MTSQKWPAGTSPAIIQVFYQKGDVPFVYGVNGWMTQESITEINTEIAEYADVYFEEGNGDYLLRALYFEGQSCPESGRWEIAPCWQLEFIEFRAIEKPSQQEESIALDSEEVVASEEIPF